ncbi:MAG: tRNA lysidine(34) synthetase TilS, partial [Burkholderiaceae bacterium]
MPRRVGIAFSGGLDSSVLLDACAGYARRHPSGSIEFHALHVHHGLSPHADAWEAHCRRTAADAGIGYATASVRIASGDRRGIEAAARAERYAALGTLCRERGIALLLTAQHSDDQAETLLLQLFRGAGLRGLSGMAAFQPAHPLLGPDIALGRPFLDLSREALEARAGAAGLVHVDDESNADLRYRRNALRRDLLPGVAQHFPGAAAAIARSARHLQSAQGLLDDLARIDLAACAAPDDVRALEVPALRALSPDRVDNLLRHWLQEAGIRPPSAARLADLRTQLLEAAPDGRPCFAIGGWQLVRFRDRLRLTRSPPFDAPPPIALHWRGEPALPVPAWQGRRVVEPAGGLGWPKSAL